MEKKQTKNLDKWKFSNQNWKRVLAEISNYAPNRYGRGKLQSYQDDHPLAKRLKIKGYELGLIMAFLEDQGLIEYDKPDYNWINLTSKGFDVALQNQSAGRTVRISRITVFFSAAITVSALASLLLGIDDVILKWAVTAVISVGLIVIGALVVRL